MSSINQLSSISSLSAGDLLAFWDASNSDSRKASLTTLMAFLQANLTFTSGLYFGAYTTQYAAPSATGFSVTITDGSSDNTNVHLILTPVAGYAAGTIVLPAVASCVDAQEVLVNCTQAVTTLTINGNGATAVTGEPTTLAANDYFRLKFDLPTKTWYRVG
jgi:hypothetical protein